MSWAPIKETYFDDGILKLSAGEEYVYWTPSHESRENAILRLKSKIRRRAEEEEK